MLSNIQRRRQRGVYDIFVVFLFCHTHTQFVRALRLRSTATTMKIKTTNYKKNIVDQNAVNMKTEKSTRCLQKAGVFSTVIFSSLIKRDLRRSNTQNFIVGNPTFHFFRFTGGRFLCTDFTV